MNTANEQQATPAPEPEQKKEKQQSFSQWLASNEGKNEVASVLAANSGMDAPRFIAGLGEALKTSMQSPRFAEKFLATPPDAVKAQVLKAAKFGLDFAPLNQQVYFVLYPEPSIVVSYRGQRALIERTGRVSRMSAGAVYEGDKFSLIKGSEESVRHEPCLRHADRGGLLGFYAVAKMAGQEVQAEYMSKEDIDAIKNSRKNKRDGMASPWDTHYDEMGKKTALRRLMKNFDVAIGITAAEEDEEFLPPKETRHVQSNVSLIDALKAGEKNVTPQN